MGCTSSSLNRRRRSITTNRGRRLVLNPRQSISVVGVVVDRDCPWNVIDSGSGDPLHPLHRKHPLSYGGDKTEDFLYPGNPNSGLVDCDCGDCDSVADHGHVCAHFESPPKLSALQERRLRCANLEVPALGLSDLSSDEDNDESDGFEFAKLEGRVSSFDPDQAGPVWTPIDSEQGAEKGPLLGYGETPTPSGTSVSEDMDMVVKDPLMSKPELEVFISPDYAEFTSDSWPSPSPYLERFQSNSDDHQPMASPTCDDHQPMPSPTSDELQPMTSPTSNDNQSMASPTSDDQIFFPGFTTHVSSECGSISPSCTSFSESISEYCPVDDGYREDQVFNKWNYQFPSWSNRSPSDSSYGHDRSESIHSYEDVEDGWIPGSFPVFSDRSLASNLHEGDPYRALIPGLPNDLAQLCLMRVPFIKYNPAFRMVSKQWRMVLSSEEFFNTRSALGIHEVHISFVVHGNRVQIFSLQSHQWFCLPPLPREDGSMSPGWRYSPEWDLAHRYSPEASSDWGIDPYDWWQIDTVAVSGGTLYVIGGDQAELQSFSRPSRPTNRVHKYDFCRNCWILVSPMQVPRSHSAAVSLGKFVYVAGGSEDVDEGASAEVYDPDDNRWTSIPKMNTSMRTCVGLQHNGCFYVKGESTRQGCHLEGEYFNPSQNTWSRMSSGMRRGLERGPIASCDSNLFVADWKDSVLKMYDPLQDSWIVVTELPAKISRLVGCHKHLYGLTGKVKVDPYNHQVISDVPAEVWRLNLENGVLLEQSNDDVKSSVRGGWDSRWQCLWWDPKQMVKTGALAWVPCIAHCTLLED